MNTSKARLTEALAVSILLFPGCLARSGTEAKPSPVVEETRSYGEGVRHLPVPVEEVVATPQDVGAPKGMGILEVRLVDQNKTGPSDIPIRIEGDTIQNTTSGKDGLIRLSLSPGEYTFAVVKGCTPKLNVLWGQGARFSVLENHITRGKLGVNWEHRMHPFPPSDSSVTPHWPIGEIVELTFYVVDKCDNNNRLGGVSYPTFRFEPSPNLEVAREPRLQSDSNGIGHIFLMCRSPGVVHVFVVDSKNPADRFDLMEENLTTGFEVRCR